MATWICYHPGIKNEYYTSGDSPEAAEAAMHALLQKNHGGLASGMLANCRTYEHCEAPEDPHAVAWVEGSSNTSTESPKLGKNRKHAEERLRQTHRIWNGQYVVSAALSKVPKWIVEQAD